MRAVKLNENTVIPLGWLATVTAFLVTSGSAGVFWLTTMHADTAQAKKDIAEVRDENRDLYRAMRRFERGIIRMQVKMGINPEPQPNGEE